MKVEQPLLAGRVRGKRRRAGERDVETVSRELDVSQRKKVYEVRRAFARALESQEVVRVYTRAMSRVKTARNLVAVRVKAGESSKYEQVRVDLAEAQERDFAGSVRVEFSRALVDLGTAMARTLSPHTILEGELPGVADVREGSHTHHHGPAVLAPVVAEGQARPALVRRPELELEEARIAQARAEEDVIRAELRPQFSTGLGYMRFDQKGLPAQDGYNAIVSVNLPLADRREGDRRAARARAEAARLSRAATAARIGAEIEGAWAHMSTANSRLRELLESQGSQMGEMLSIAETSYRSGLQTLLELLDAYRLERDFQIAKVRAQGALLQAIEEYVYAIGTSPEALRPAKEEGKHAHDTK